MAKTATAAPAVPAANANPIFAALMGGSDGTPRPTFGDKVIGVVSDTFTDATEVAGELSEAFDSRFFNLGATRREAKNMTKLSRRWQMLGAELGLSDEQTAALIQARG